MIQTSWIANPLIKSPPEPGQPTEAIPVREAAQTEAAVGIRDVQLLRVYDKLNQDMFTSWKNPRHQSAVCSLSSRCHIYSP